MEQLKPFNLTILDPDEYVERKECLPITSYAMYESSTERFHPDGLYSEVIFGQLGSRERFIRRGYIDLHTKLITPHLYKQIVTLKSYYKEVLAGKQYAYYDKDLKDLVCTTKDDPNGDTGYQFFCSMYPKIKFAESDSSKRSVKIELLNKYSDRVFMSKYIVIPAAIRDVKMKDGRPESEAINKLYLGLLSLASAIPDEAGEDIVYDSIRYQMQCKVQQIYDYIINILNGKTGFSQAKYARRGIVYGSRNVITAPQMIRVQSPSAPNMLAVDQLEIPTFQAAKALAPIVTYIIHNQFGMQFVNNSTIPVINSKTLKLELRKIDETDIKKYTTSDGINDFLNDMRDTHMHQLPITLKLAKSEVYEEGTEFYPFMIYDRGEHMYRFTDIEAFKDAYPKVSRYRDDNEKLKIMDVYDMHDYVIEGTGVLYACGMDIVPEDVDVIFSPECYTKFIEFAKSKGVKADELGEYELVIDGIELHTKNNCYGVKTQAEWDKFIASDVTVIGTHQYVKPEVLAGRYRAMAGRPDRIKDKRKLEFFEDIVYDPSKVRPLTYIEFTYIITYQASIGRHFLTTRYPVLNAYNMVPYKGKIMSTVPGRIVKYHLKPDAIGKNDEYVVLDEYPVIGAPTKLSLSVHPTALGRLGGDHDGDCMSLLAIMSEDANKELDDYINSTKSIIDVSGNLVNGIDSPGGAVINMSLFFCTYGSLE